MREMPIQGATLNLTQECNLRCSYCFTHGKSNKRMSFETGKKCIELILKGVQEANINQLGRKQRIANILFGVENLFLNGT